MRRIVRGLLKEMGCNNADEAGDGAVALNMLKTPVRLRGQRHQHAEHERLRAAGRDQGDEALKHLPVLMVTAEARKEDIVPPPVGAAGYIVKPFTKATLEEKVQKIMQKLAATA